MVTAALRRQLEAAFLAAFNLDELRRVTRQALDQDLDAISAGDLRERVANIVDYADRTGALPELAGAAIRQNPGNEQLRALVDGALTVLLQKKTSIWKLPRATRA